MQRVERAPGIAITGVDFGWGSTGKLGAIVDACLRLRADLRLVVLGTRLGRPVFADRPVEAWHEHWPSDPEQLRRLLARHAVAAALVVLDPHAAESLENAGCPTVYVDSLPYLWTAADPVPYGVAAYCAQRCSDLPPAARRLLDRIDRLHWVEGITADVPRHPRQPRHAVLNLGGLHSPVQLAGNPAYLRLVLAPGLRALERAGYGPVDVCGNITSREVAAAVPEVDLEVEAGPRAHADFLALLAKTDLLLTSPGLTTLLEAGGRNTRTVCLPPQNISQIFNGDRFAALVDADCRLGWPTDVLDLHPVEEARTAGEEAALEVMDRALRTASINRVHPWLLDRLGAAIHRAEGLAHWSGLSDQAGRRGADQVARILLEVAEGTGSAPTGAGRGLS